MVDRVSVQGMPGTRRSVSEYLVSVSTDNKTFTGVLEAEDGRKVRKIKKITRFPNYLAYYSNILPDWQVNT